MSSFCDDDILQSVDTTDRVFKGDHYVLRRSETTDTEWKLKRVPAGDPPTGWKFRDRSFEVLTNGKQHTNQTAEFNDVVSGGVVYENETLKFGGGGGPVFTIIKS